ncbi:brain tumor protein [Patella vulgata]|uniref:brain tumor protein n=1 Tax=Patella vulgata TaxID=6465 RepID=UPI00217F26B2|nr:brain tumor protein [Patella vulgata]XP_050417220.1 brain tumor protein [Patella vulgata]
MATKEETNLDLDLDLELEESPSSSPTLVNEQQQCPICTKKLTQPKILACLHVFCEACLENQLEEKAIEGVKPLKVKCTVCEQDTQVPMKGVQDLQTEHVLSDMLDMSGVESMQIVCTSCKAKEKAVARCSDCANFLCPNCVTAHKFMRCFENHKVLSFDELKSSDGLSIHKPIFCSVHSSENLKYFCHTCEIPICSECMVNDHRMPDHNYEKLADVEDDQKKDLENLVTECQSKLEPCRSAASRAEGALSELQSQQEDAKSLIEETFQSYKAILEKRKTALLNELDEIHSHHELELMGLCHSVNNMMDKIEDSCKFTEHILKNGSSLQIAVLKRIISTQLMSLINNTPAVETDLNIEFKSDPAVFEKMVEDHFGSFGRDEPKRENQLSPLHSSFENEGFNLPHGVLNQDVNMMPSSSNGFMSNMASLPPVSLSGNLQSLSSLIANIPSHLTGPSHPMHDPSLSRNSHSPAMSDSGISVGDAASTNSNNSATMINIAAMASLGQVSLGGHMLSGLSGGMNTNTGSTSSDGSSRTQTPLSHNEMSPTSMASLPSIAERAENTNLDNLASLFNPHTTSFSKIIDNMRSISVSGGGPGMDNMITGAAGGSRDIAGITTPTIGNTFTYPPIRRGDQMSSMQIRCKFGQLGPGKGQFNSPHGFCLGIEEDIIVADTNNHRIQVFDKTGDFKYQFGIPGREEGQLWYPRKIAVMRSSGKYVVCDRGNERSRMQIFTRNGHFVKKIAIRYIDIVAGLAITSQGNIVAVDSVSPTVFCIGESGDLIKWFDCSDYMREPSDIAVSGTEYFVCDFKGHCVVVFSEEGQFLRRIGCENITNYPNGIDISDAGDVLIGDSHGNRFHVGVFQRDGSLIGEFQCPYVKVSRCCGLKITSEGYVVTLAKNNHHVLVLNTLYIT